MKDSFDPAISLHMHSTSAIDLNNITWAYNLIPNSKKRSRYRNLALASVERPKLK